VKRQATGSATDGIAELEEFLSFRVSTLAKLLDRRLARLVGDRFGLAVAEYRALTYIVMRPQSTVRAIAAGTFTDKAQISRAIAALEARGLVTRLIPGTDRRSPVFTATRTGKNTVNRILPLRRRQEQELAESVGLADANALAKTCQALIEQLTDPTSAVPVSRGR
jgi:DNA-binding MarR family transcriptional regulator